MKVLIVDDEVRVRDLIAAFVEQLGYEPVPAPSAMRALELLDLEPIRIVITDWLMPGMTGLEFMQRIRAAGRQRYTYVIMLTALGGGAHYLEGMRAGADDFAGKPISLEELGARLRVAQRITGLQEHVRLLEGVLSICMYCKDVRVTGDAWTTIERYVEERSDASFSHDVCPACYETRVLPELRSLDRPATGTEP
jgi:DNA-binding response OmpR family regulator